MKTHLFIARSLILCMVIFACHKSFQDSQPQTGPQLEQDSVLLVNADSPAAPLAPYPQSPLAGCAYDPGYGDSIVYAQPTNGQDYIVKPVNNPGPGSYLSWPAGLVIDSLTGAIDVTASETGERYAIGFVKKGTTDTCLTSLIIGGASYMDSIYVLDQNEGQAAPYFDANPNLISICGGQGNGGPSCSFSVTGSTNHKLVIDPSTGVIDLNKSLKGIFGSNPVNGQGAAITINYQLNDASNLATQHIQVDVLYYDSQSSMNAGLVAKIKNKHAQEVTGLLIAPGGNPRPPLIVIVRRL
jgi:hypothetical protein